LAVGVTDILNLMESAESDQDGQGFTDYLPNLGSSRFAVGEVLKSS
jgi:hypothetical protein